MSAKSTNPASRQRRAAADCINQALASSDIAGICRAIGAATQLYNISELAQKTGLSRPSIYRAFAGNPQKPNFTTVLNILDAMGFQLHVTVRKDGALKRICRQPGV
jgi:probable addiction module antidote protein